MSDKTIPERESVSDMLGRLSRMSRGEPTWDLSDNDCAAIKWLLNERKASEAKVRELEQALQGIMQLIEHGVLVRDTSRDVETGWALHQLPLLCALQKAQAALHVADKAAEPEPEPDPVERFYCTERGPRSNERCTRLPDHAGRHIGRSEGWYTTQPALHVTDKAVKP